MQPGAGHIVAKDITIAYGDFVVQRDLNFSVNRGDVFVIMGGSGCGKSTLLKVMIGLKKPAKGDIYYEDEPFWASGEDEREALKRKFGTLFQSGALWSSMTLAENIGLALKQYTRSGRSWTTSSCSSGWPGSRTTIPTRYPGA